MEFRESDLTPAAVLEARTPPEMQAETDPRDGKGNPH